MTQTSQSYNSKKRALGFYGGLAGLSISIAWGLLAAKQGHPLQAWTSMTIAWSGYLVSHYAETGRCIDPKYREPQVPEDTSNISGSLIGIVTLLIGVIVAANGLHSTDFLLTVLGSTLFVAGYMIAHHSMTDLLL
ncbi:MAG: hypothetical protein SV186_00780 [Candidatus Nanohaloarchaea archaeon]|nr:hypothetical protein [Candidatus Nanohaloarchaea archaeon]